MNLKLRKMVLIVANDDLVRTTLVRELDREGFIALGTRDLTSARQILTVGLKPDCIAVFDIDYEQVHNCCSEFRRNFEDIPIFSNYFLDDLSIKPLIDYRNTQLVINSILDAMDGCTIYPLVWHQKFKMRKTA